jgi:hypothetical protein
MKALRCTPLICLLALSLAAVAPAQDEQIKAIAKAFAATEAQLQSISHFEWKAVDLNEEFTHHYQAWRNDEGQIVKVSDQLERLTTRELTEYFFSGEKLNFVLQRMEENEDGGGGTVTESRCYIAGGKIIRKQTKSAKFKEGQKRDTSAAKPVEAKPGEGDDPAAWSAQALKLAAALQAGPPIEDGAETPADAPGEAAPQASGNELPEGPASKFSAIIEESASPDGRYAVAWGLNIPGKGPQRSDEMADENQEGLVNYIVDFQADKALAITGGTHFGPKPSYNHWEHRALWSADSSLLIQTLDMKWATVSAEAFRIAGGKATRMTSVLADVQAAVEAKLAKSHAKAWKASGDKCTFTISELKLGKGDTLSLTAYHQIPKEEGGFTSQVNGQFDAEGKFVAKDITITAD